MSKAQLNKDFGFSEETIEKWAQEYESSDWSNMEFGEPEYANQRIFEGPMENVNVVLPHGAIIAMKKYCDAQDISRSELVRRAVSRELANA